MGEEIIAEHDRGRVVECAINGGTAPARRCLIDDVVVNECRGVKEFDRRGEWDEETEIVAAETAAEESKRRTQKLAASG